MTGAPAAALRCDLQAHSHHSDGTLAPADVVTAARAAGVELLALTDHDSVEGVPEALEAAARSGLLLLPAVEISAVDADHEDLHVLGYGIDHRDETLLERLRGARADRELRAERMVERLRELGYAVDDEPLRARRAAGEAIGRPHIAAAAIGHPANRERLRAEQSDDVTPFIRAHLVPGASAYARRSGPTIAEAIGWIHDAGGLAVWAHPFWDLEAPDQVLASLDRYHAHGLDGVEAFYVTHTAEQIALLAQRAAELGCLATASSDFHGPGHRLFGRFLAYELHGRSPILGRLAEVPGVPAREL